jgi:hypothetical protein
MLPGFLRVESLESDHPVAQKLIQKHGASIKHGVDPEYCCKEKGREEEGGAVRDKLSYTIACWEAALPSFAVRFLDHVGWIATLPVSQRTKKVGAYWAGNVGDAETIKKGRPLGADAKYFAQQGGWMASREQVSRWDSACTGGFLPPFTEPLAHNGGLDNNVEFWSGGFHLFGKYCNVQRIISLDSEEFSKQLIYHSSNNKHRTLAPNRMIRIDEIYGQLVEAQGVIEKDY